VAPRAFAPPAGKKGETAGEVGIEGTIIEAPAPGTPPLDALKLKYYDLLVRYYNHAGSAVDVARCYRAQFDTPSLQARDDAGAAADAALKRVCWYTALAPASSDRTTLMAAAAAEPRMDGLPGYKALLSTFTSKEIVWWPAFEEAHAREMDVCADVFGGAAGSPGAARRVALRSRVIEHNIHTAAAYYVRMPTARLAALLGLDPDDAERRVADMVTGGALAAKIDRPAGIIRFGARPAADDTLNAWAADVGKLLALVEKAAAGVAKEATQYGVAELAELAV
jgi:26S proteasome regulatory subunit N5